MIVHNNYTATACVKTFFTLIKPLYSCVYTYTYINIPHTFDERMYHCQFNRQKGGVLSQTRDFNNLFSVINCFWGSFEEEQ